jgi:drug/metabolite transporter (DMT)-like permease
VDAVTLIMLRMLFALPLFVALAWWAGRGQRRWLRRDWRAVALLGFSGYYLASFLDFWGLQLHQRQPGAADPVPGADAGAAAGALLFRHAVAPRQMLALAVSYAGVLLVFGQELRSMRPAHRAGRGWCSPAR